VRSKSVNIQDSTVLFYGKQSTTVVVCQSKNKSILKSVLRQLSLANVLLKNLPKIRNKSSAVAEVGDGGHNRHGPKIGGSAAFWGRGAGSQSNTTSHGLRPTSLPSDIMIIQPFGHNKDGPKIGGL